MAEFRSCPVSKGGRRRVWFPLAAWTMAVVALGAGCERSTDASRAALADRRASWAREIGELRAQCTALAARLDGRPGPGTGTSAEIAARRTRASLDGVRQSITDVETQLSQVAERVEEAISKGREAGEAIDAESGRARVALQALAQQVGTTAGQVGDYLLGAAGPTRTASTP